jgi:hypothetical protein
MTEALNGTFKAELIEIGPLEGRRPGRAGDLPVGHVVQRRTPPFRTRLRATGRVRASLLAQPEANPAVRLKQDRRTLRNSGQLKEFHRRPTARSS